ncbi:MAG TPA: ribosomal L7Ae/L30e/S12e/Gadd45 family protein [Virgibacillus sp.]|nr:ribosomal L7Ae/L30e/S12e/Gadd45 family protein [Virgibacillus sp.]
MNSSYLNLLGLAFRARKCSTGEEVIIRDIRRRRAELVILARDIGRQTEKRLTDKCKTYGIPFLMADDTDVLSHAIGKEKRVAIAVLDEGFAKKIQTLLS